jgi:NitT/TauT family transport system permease protein
VSAVASSPRSLPGEPAPAGRWARRARHYLPAVAVFVAAIILWEVIVQAGALGSLPLPSPTEIVAALGANWGSGRWPLGEAAAATLFEAIGGLLIGTVAGVAVAFAAGRFATARELLLPLAVAAPR